MAAIGSDQRLHRLFFVSILLKGLDGVFETVGGALLLFLGPEAINRVLLLVLAHEFAEDPHDWLAGLIQHGMGKLSAGAERFAGIYLLGHGLVKVLLVTGLLRGFLWAYPTAITVLGAFIVYQVGRILHRHSMALLVFTVVDLCIVFVIWREYRNVRRRGLGGSGQA